MCNPHRTARTCEGVGRADGHDDASHREVRQGQAHDEHVGHLERKVGEDESSLLDFSFAPQGTMFICQKGGARRSYGVMPGVRVSVVFNCPPLHFVTIDNGEGGGAEKVEEEKWISRKFPPLSSRVRRV